MRLALVELAQPAPLPIGCRTWSEVASVYQEELRRRAEIARAALPVVARPPREPVPAVQPVARITWKAED